MRQNRKPEAAKASSGSRGPSAETRNRKPEAAKASSGSRGPPAETGNRKPEPEMGKNRETCGNMVKHGEILGK